MVVFAAIAFAQSESELKQRVQARAQAVSALHKSGIVREGANGLLAATTTLDAPQAQTVQEENKDRQAIFALIAKKSKLTSDEVAAMYARRAQKLIAEPGPFTGYCSEIRLSGICLQHKALHLGSELLHIV
jgi:uncharacterized protein YdbL (DUF1318 family)